MRSITDLPCLLFILLLFNLNADATPDVFSDGGSGSRSCEGSLLLLRMLAEGAGAVQLRIMGNVSRMDWSAAEQAPDFQIEVEDIEEEGENMKHEEEEVKNFKHKEEDNSDYIGTNAVLVEMAKQGVFFEDDPASQRILDEFEKAKTKTKDLEQGEIRIGPKGEKIKRLPMLQEEKMGSLVLSEKDRSTHTVDASKSLGKHREKWLNVKYRHQRNERETMSAVNEGACCWRLYARPLFRGRQQLINRQSMSHWLERVLL